MAGYKEGKLIVPGGYDMKKLEVDGENYFGLMVEMNIYEDLTSNVMTGDVTFADAYNLLTNKPFKEGTIVEMEAKDLKGTSHPESGSIKIKMEVVKVINRKTVKQDVQIYTLILASGGWSSNLMKRVSKSFPQKKYSEMAQEVFDDYLSVDKGISDGFDGKSLDAEESEGMYNVVIPNWTPLRTINWLAARSRKKDACNFLFWEDLEGFNFKPVDKLMEEDAVATYYHQTQNTEDNSNTYFNVEEVNFRDTDDVLFHALSGMFGNVMVEVDMTKKLITHYSDEVKDGGHYKKEDVFKYSDNFGKIKHADTDDGKPFIEDDSIFTESAKRMLIPKHTYGHDDMEHYEHEKWVRERISQRVSLDYMGLHVWAMGSFKRKVGDKVEFMYNSPEARQGGEPKKDKKVSGNYLVKAIRRKFDQTQFVMAMDLIKDNEL